MRKTFTFLYSTQFPFSDSFPQNENSEITNFQSSTTINYFLSERRSVICSMNATLRSNTFMGFILSELPLINEVTTHLPENVNLKQPDFSQLIQVLCVSVSERLRFLHSTFMSYKSMSTFQNPTSLLLNLI